MFKVFCKCDFVLESVRGVLDCGIWIEWGLRVCLALAWVMRWTAEELSFEVVRTEDGNFDEEEFA